MNSPPLLKATAVADGLTLTAEGSWTLDYSSRLEQAVAEAELKIEQSRQLMLDLSRLGELDTLGTWLFERLMRKSSGAGHEARMIGLPERYAGIVEEIRTVNRQPAQGKPRKNVFARAIERLSAWLLSVQQESMILLDMLGKIALSLLRSCIHPRTFRLTSVTHHIYRIGWQAIPIMTLITFLIGGIIAQQGIFHFRKFGAESYVVDLVGILVLREIGVLIVAIMAAGRSGSAYTAELGSMKMREEIDALLTMGSNPADVLILPRVLALVVALPILTFAGSMAAMVGAGMVAWLYGGMSPAAFLDRLHDAVSVTHFEVGLIKAPFMALTIGAVACAEGFRVKGSAESLGRQTTTSVVKSIFLVIVLDGLFAVFFASIGM
jgi:phospholipid/cholesterol/gamma-HCH transport system permease protein